MRTLYPDIEPYQQFFMATGGAHKVYVEISGNPGGFPVLFLHGGPCSGTRPGHRRYFDPERYRIVLFDQRGCGLSEPFGELSDNTTQALCDDMERLRQTLQIERWLLFGGSWGAALALIYAQRHPGRVAGMILRGVFLARFRDLQWFIGDGVRRIYPEQWRRLAGPAPAAEQHALLQDLWRQLTGSDEITKRRIAREWLAWGEQVTLGARYDPHGRCQPITARMVKQAAMELHYGVNRYFLSENQILENCAGLGAIPTRIVHGRQDLVCPVEAALDLAEALPQSELVILPEAGHIGQSPDMIDALVTATDHFANSALD